jgi:hypothetical protein
MPIKTPTGFGDVSDVTSLYHLSKGINLILKADFFKILKPNSNTLLIFFLSARILKKLLTFGKKIWR